MPRSRSRKGISDIVANLLIMTMVVALFAMVILWAGGYLGQSQGIWNVQSQRAQEAIVIETAEYDGTNLAVYVRNVGTSTVKLNVFYIRGGTVDTTVLSSDPSFKFFKDPMDSTSTSDGTIVSKELVRIEITPPALPDRVLQSGDSYRLELVTTLGADAAFIYVVP